MAQQTESDKLLNSFETTNTSIEFWILVTSEGVPFKYSSSIVFDKNLAEKSEQDAQNKNYMEAVRIAGLVSDLINYTKRTIEDFKKGQTGNICIRLRLKDDKEIIIQQEQDFYLITKQVCKTVVDEVEQSK